MVQIPRSIERISS